MDALGAMKDSNQNNMILNYVQKILLIGKNSHTIKNIFDKSWNKKKGNLANSPLAREMNQHSDF